ncbi:MAG: SUMF1/EgtB/PvdO family nonheme iron enzyme [Caldilineaceae bacterium]|nr:SUMF1/EgtB/PvdO family nonheme iron enzyme [Caldilineaceae bacterium]
MLTGRQIEQAQNALLEAFPSRDALRMLARIELDENLDAIAGGDNLRVIAFNLVSWAEQTGVFARLVDGAVRQNDGNTTLRELQRALRAWTGGAPAGAATRKHGTRPQATIDIFLSYSRYDRTSMFDVHDILRGAGFSVWIDDGIEPGTAIWEDAIEEALHQAQAMVVLLSPNAKASQWVKREITYAMAQEKAVFPLLIAGDQRTAVPLSLITTQWVDGRNDVARAAQGHLLPAVQRHLRPDEVAAAPVPSPAPSAPARQPAAQAAPPVAFDWVEIPAGKFLMGSDKKRDDQAFDDELPQHTMTLPAYRMARVPVTVAQFAAFVEATGYKTQAERDGKAWSYTGSKWDWLQGANWRHPRGPESDVRQKQDHPVTCVTVRDAVAFCEWAGKATSTAVRLPSEAEWEKAARGTDGRIYPWGDAKPTKEHCNFEMNVGDTTPVGAYPKGASPYGLLDMAGNVWEWTSTKWVDSYKNYRPDDSLKGDASRTVRGGSFGVNDRLVRCACRNPDDNPNDDVGFRVVSPGF